MANRNRRTHRAGICARLGALTCGLLGTSLAVLLLIAAAAIDIN